MPADADPGMPNTLAIVASATFAEPISEKVV